MRTNLIYSSDDDYCEHYEYECPCGNGKIVEDHDNTPGFRSHHVYILCKECKHKYKLDTSTGVSNWELVKE